MNKENFKRCLPLLLILLPILILPFPWYRNMIFKPFEESVKNTTGIHAILDSQMRLGIIYILCIMMQLLSIKSSKLAYSVISNLILVGAFICYPMEISVLGRVPVYHFYHAGCYIAVLLISAGVVFDIVYLIKYRKESNGLC